MLHTFTTRGYPVLAAMLAGSLLTVSLTPSSAFAAPAIPTAEDIRAAEDSTARTGELVTEIESILEDAAAELQAAQVEAMKSQGAYIDALAELDDRRAAAQRLSALASEAEQTYRTASSELGQLAADIYRAGGIMPDSSLLAFAQDPGSIMYQASTVEGMAASRSRTVSQAETAASSLDSLKADARQAEEAAAEAAETAEAAGAATEAAMATAASLVEQKQAERATLVAQLAELRDTTAALEEQRIAGLEQARREAELARILAASAEAAAALPAAPAAPRPAAPTLVPPAEAEPAVPRAPLTAPAPVQPPASERPNAPAPRPTTPAPTPAPAPPAPAPAPAPAPPAPAPAPPAPAPKPTPPPPAPPATNTGGVASAVNYARARIGAPYYYQWGGNGPRGYDCSGLTQQAFAAGGISLPRTASAQYYAARTHVPLSQAQYGDLVFWGEGAGIWHVAIYVGNNTVVNALNPSQGIVEVNLANMSGMGALNPLAARF
ncbi:Cell wall-associated hydrolase, NlpC family [Arthrobacter subterraneus]|uniref:Cell wall-associated hydrolase, NlpC family n=1 Tax=Arthrobacter subterraneus TaxID=335973 RepID=A0A1G8M6T8_9MICC|nr:C40 family peptidase [Arthrobacter subterraneus]SDI63080.1 Cell wall-associated hydrolase, NlpC family [Arthrobacter subterraneus]